MPLGEFTLDYRDNHPEIKDISFEGFRSGFKVNQKMIDQVVEIGKSKGIRPNPKELARSQDFLKFLITARIARDLFDDNAFYIVFNETNEIYRKAIELFIDPSQLQNEANGTLLQTR